MVVSWLGLWASGGEGAGSIPTPGTQFSSIVQSCPTLCDPMDCSTPGFPVLHHLAQTHAHWVGDVIQTSHPRSSPSPAFNLSQHQGLFKWVSSSHHVTKLLELQLQHQSFRWIFRTDFLRIDWLDLLAVQGTLKSLLQHHSSKASILQCSAFFMVQFSHPYMTTGKTIALTRWTFIGKVISLLLIFCLGLSQLFFQGETSFNLMAAVIFCSDFVSQENRLSLFPHLFAISDGSGCHELHFLNFEF